MFPAFAANENQNRGHACKQMSGREINLAFRGFSFEESGLYSDFRGKYGRY